MIATDRTGNHKAYDEIYDWIDNGKQSRLSPEAQVLAEDLFQFAARIQRTCRTRADGSGIDLASNVKNLSKMVGTLQMLLPRNRRA